jgi:hypothetical protein
MWNKSSGIAESGQLEGKRLEKVPFLVAFWFAWNDFHTETELYEPPSSEDTTAP